MARGSQRKYNVIPFGILIGTGICLIAALVHLFSNPPSPLPVYQGANSYVHHSSDLAVQAASSFSSSTRVSHRTVSPSSHSHVQPSYYPPSPITVQLSSARAHVVGSGVVIGSHYARTIANESQHRTYATTSVPNPIATLSAEDSRFSVRNTLRVVSDESIEGQEAMAYSPASTLSVTNSRFSVNRPLSAASGKSVVGQSISRIAPPGDDGSAEIGSEPGNIAPPGDGGILIGEAPIGDVPWVCMMVMAVGLGLYRGRRRHQSVTKMGLFISKNKKRKIVHYVLIKKFFFV